MTSGCVLPEPLVLPTAVMSPHLQLGVCSRVLRVASVYLEKKLSNLVEVIGNQPNIFRMRNFGACHTVIFCDFSPLRLFKNMIHFPREQHAYPLFAFPSPYCGAEGIPSAFHDSQPTASTVILG